MITTLEVPDVGQDIYQQVMDCSAKLESGTNRHKVMKVMAD